MSTWYENNLQYRFLVPQPAAGGIIGRKGENIKRLRAEYGVDISVPASDAPERLLIMTTDIRSLRLVLVDILETVKDCMHAKINDPKDINSGILPDGSISPEMDLRFLVSENVCGAIIGKKGECIRRLTETYRVSVFKVYQQMCPQSTDRIIRLVGYPEDILNCIEAIHDIIVTLKDVKSTREYDPDNCNELNAVNYGGWVSLETRRGMSQYAGGTDPNASRYANSTPLPGPADNYGNRPDMNMQSQFMGGYGFQPHNPFQLTLNPNETPTPMMPYNSNNQQSYYSPDGTGDSGYNYYAAQPSNTIGPPNFQAMNSNITPAVIPAHTPSFAGIPLGHMADYAHPENIMIELQQEMTSSQVSNYQIPGNYTASTPIGAPGSVEISHVSLPNKLIGAIMGRGGCRINDIREATGARIDVDKDVLPESDERVITIQGTPAQIEHAQVLLQGNVKKYGGGSRR